MTLTSAQAAVREKLAELAEKQQVFGEGSVSVPGLTVPQMLNGDANRDLQKDYESALNTNNTLAMVYIRRAATYERFAAALESSLEQERAKNRSAKS